MPKGGFGNLIALPLQKEPRENGCSVFVDADLRRVYRTNGHSWRPSSRCQRTTSSPPSCAPTGGAHPLDVTFIDEEDQAQPWKRSDSSHQEADRADAEVARP